MMYAERPQRQNASTQDVLDSAYEKPPEYRNPNQTVYFVAQLKS
jgi:hypothetical protein